jgi:hypothetical protein
MTNVLPALAVAVAAFCVWLTVRVINRHERWAKWMLAVVISLPVLYVPSFGPACWISSRHDGRVPSFYWPIGWVAARSATTLRFVTWYATAGMEVSSSISVTRMPGRHARHPDMAIIITR